MELKTITANGYEIGYIDRGNGIKKQMNQILQISHFIHKVHMNLTIQIIFLTQS